VLDISPDKVLVVLVIALSVLGPSRLLEVARGLGRARAQLHRLTNGLPPQTAKIMRDPRGALIDALAEPRQVIVDAAKMSTQAMSGDVNCRQSTEGRGADPGDEGVP
jgi:Sec-independent protein translocase protein TatA